MSVEQRQQNGLPPWNPHTAWILAVTVIAFAAIVLLALTGHAVTAGVIATVWAGTCGVIKRTGTTS